MAEKDLSIYFSPITDDFFSPDDSENSLSHAVEIFVGKSFPDWKKAQIALIGVKEERGNVNNTGAAQAPDAVRAELYKLYKDFDTKNIVDLGNILPGDTTDDTWYALRDVVFELNKKDVVPIILGGSQDITYANYLAYEKLEQTINMLTIDAQLKIGDVDDSLTADSFLSKIILHQPNFLFNYTALAYQSYYSDPAVLKLMDHLYFDTYRLGYVQGDLKSAEPIVRNCDILSFDVSAIRGSEAPANGNAGPNGLFGNEACQLAWYAGMSDKLSSLGLYELNPGLDRNGQTAALVAQMIWYFIKGFYNRKGDFPVANKQDYTKYRVQIKDPDHEIIFYKSDRSDRWWMEVPYPQNMEFKFARHHMIPCSYNDYQQAAKGIMPDLWWKTYQKLS